MIRMDLALVIAMSASLVFAADTKVAKEQPKELGLVKFGRDFDAAVATAKKEKKPLFVLFDEVPG